jgi:hypothetical protein
VSIEVATAEDQAGNPAPIDVAALRQAARDQLSRAEIFARPEPDRGVAKGGVARVRIEVGLEEVRVEKKAAARAGIRLRIDVRPSGSTAPHWSEDVQAGSETTYDIASKTDRNVVFGKLASRTIQDLLVAYIDRQKVWLAASQDLHRILTSDAGELRLEAIRAVGERRIAGEGATLLGLLEDPEEAIRDAALGALIELRDRRAVSVLGKSRSMRDRREMRKILDAMATLGGEEAADYLSFVADAHEDEEIRNMAKEAQQRLKRKQESLTQKRRSEGE